MIRHTRRFFFWYLLALVLLLQALPLLGRAVGSIEGRLFPVVDTLHLNPDKVQRIDGTFQIRFPGWAWKHRNCQPIRMEWHIGHRGDLFQEEVRSDLADRPMLRPTGKLHWESILVDMTPNQLLHRSYADALHDCGWPWLTRSRFYDAPPLPYEEPSP